MNKRRVKKAIKKVMAALAGDTKKRPRIRPGEIKAFKRQK